MVNRPPSTRDSAAVILLFSLVWAGVSVPILISPLGSYPVVDASWHMEWASAAADGEPFIYAPYFRAPLYPWVLALLFAVTGPSLISGALLSFLFSLMSVHLVHRIVHRTSGRVAGLFAAGVMGLNGVFLFYSSTLLITPLFTLLLLLSFYCFQFREPSSAGMLFLGLAAVARPSAVLLFPLVLILYRHSRKYFWLFLVPVCTIWAVNALHGDGRTVISSQGGVNFFIGSGPEADGFTAFAPERGPYGFPDDSLPYTDNVLSAGGSHFPPGTVPSEISAGWTGRTLEHIMKSPGNFLFLLLKKVLYIVSPVAIPSNYSVYYYGRYSPLLAVLTGTPNFPAAGLILWFLLPGALLAGSLGSFEKKALLWAVVLLFGLLPFFITARFRLPALPFLVILLAPRFMRRAKTGLKLAPIGVAAGLGIALLTSNTVPEGGVNMAFHDGLAHHRLGERGRAQLLFLEAYETALGRTDGVDLNGTDALFNLGVAALERGHAEEAEMYWRLALERNPGFAPAIAALQGLTR